MQHEPLQKLTDQLRRLEHRVTGPRQAILEALRDQAHPLPIRTIHTSLPDTCDLATVYRAMHLLENNGMVKRFDFGDGTARFELINAGDNGHHHHLICRQCSSVVELKECFPSKLEKKIAKQNSYIAISHKLEFFGICPECQ